jgi:DNA polymerase
LKSFAELRKGIENCTKCSLYKTRTNVVLDQKPQKTVLFLLGEAPGGHEDMVSGEPFSGEAGKILTDFLAQIDLDRKHCYLGNTVKCRPTKPSSRGRFGPYANRKPTSAEIKSCSSWVEAEIGLVKPKVIATLGGVPLSTILGKQARLEDYHGKYFYSAKYGCFIFPLYHPASIIYRRQLAQTYAQDVFKLKEFLQELKKQGN